MDKNVHINVWLFYLIWGYGICWMFVWFIIYALLPISFFTISILLLRINISKMLVYNFVDKPVDMSVENRLGEAITMYLVYNFLGYQEILCRSYMLLAGHFPLREYGLIHT
jgi:hypothetical protein